MGGGKVTFRMTFAIRQSNPRILVWFAVMPALALLLARGIRPPGPAPNRAPSAAERLAAARQWLANQPLSFEPNMGQAPAGVRFLARSRGFEVALESLQAVVTVGSGSSGSGGSQQVRVIPLNANPAAKWVGEAALAGHSNYFLGNDPSQWRTGIPHYGAVRAAGIYRGVDLVFYGDARQLEFDWDVAPGGDVQAIRLRLEGSRYLRPDGQGGLRVGLANGEIVLKAPQAEQVINGSPRSVGAHLFAAGSDVAGVHLEGYDPRRAVRIDPLIIFSTFLGGVGTDTATAMAVDASGNIYITGQTNSTNFPTMHPLQTTCLGGCGAQNSAVFVTEMANTGTSLVYSTYLGGSAMDQGQGIAVDSAGNAYVTGTVTSPNFPLQKPYQQVLRGVQDAFVTKIAAGGSALVFSTYFGGSNIETGASIAIDNNQNVYITGSTVSLDFPLVNAYQTVCSACSAGGANAFVAGFNSTGQALIYSTYLGGSVHDTGTAITMDGSADAYVAGITSSSDFPLANSYQSALLGSQNTFVCELNSTGNQLLFSTYLGGSLQDAANAITLDFAGNIYVAGTTSSPNFPVLNAYQQLLTGASNAFVTEFSPGGAPLVYSTYLGGINTDTATAIAVNSLGEAFVAGKTNSATFPVVNALQPVCAGGCAFNDAFVANLSAGGGELLYSTFLGGSGDDGATGIAVDSSNDIYVAGTTGSVDFPTLNPFQGSCGGGCPSGATDAFIAKLLTPSLPQVSLAPSSLNITGAANSSVTSPVTLTNSGKATLTINAITVTGNGFSVSNNCGTSLAAGANCTISVTFNFATAGNATGTLSISDNAAGSPQSVTLSATSGNFVLQPSPGTPSSITINAGYQANFSVTIYPNGFSGQVTLTCGGAPQNSTCTLSTSSVALGGTTAVGIGVAVATTARSVAQIGGGRGNRGLPAGWAGIIALAGLLSLICWSTPGIGRGRVAGRFAAALLLASAAMACGTGTGSSSPATPATGTPAGTYTIVVTGTSGTLSQSANLTLQVK